MVLLSDKDTNCQWNACNSLGEMGKEAAKALSLLQALADDAKAQAPVRSAAAQAVRAVKA